MQQYHVPLLGLRYWIALCLASIFGANMGDFCAHNLGLGHVAGLPYLALALVLVFVAERASIARSMKGLLLADDCAGADRGDELGRFLQRRFEACQAIGYGWAHGVAGAERCRGMAAGVAQLGRQALTLRAIFCVPISGYWVAMLTAGTLGTVLGDYFSHDLHFGHVGASVALSALLAPFFIAGVRQLLMVAAPVYWATIVMIRAAGTAVGDVLAERNNLWLGIEHCGDRPGLRRVPDFVAERAPRYGRCLRELAYRPRSERLRISLLRASGTRSGRRSAEASLGPAAARRVRRARTVFGVCPARL